MSALTPQRNRGRAPGNIDNLTRFFWFTEVHTDEVLDEEASYEKFKEAHWTWHGLTQNGTTPSFRRLANVKGPGESYFSTRQWILKQLHVEAIPRAIYMTCGNPACVSPFHMEQAKRKPKGRPRTIKMEIEFYDVRNRAKLLHSAWRNLILVEMETYKQRALPQYLS